MYFAESKDTANVYYVDMEEMVIEMWNWYGEPRMLRSTKYTHQEMCEELVAMLSRGWVKRSSDELK